jgi:hypothetical protein
VLSLKYEREDRKKEYTRRCSGFFLAGKASGHRSDDARTGSQPKLQNKRNLLRLTFFVHAVLRSINLAGRT